MKKFFLLLVAAAMFIAVGYTTATIYRVGDSVVKDGINIIFPSNGNILVPYYDETVEKVGFLRSCSEPFIVIPAEYDEMYNSEYSMIPVKKNGKWGAVEVSLSNSYKDEQPIVPCIYKKVLPISDTAVEVTMENGTKRIIDIKNGKNK